MSAMAASRRRLIGVPWTLLAAACCAMAALAAAAGVIVLGPAAALVPFVAAALFFIATRPRMSACVLFAAGIALDSRATDVTKPLALGLWAFPRGVQDALPLTVNPFEVLLALVTASVMARPAARPSGGLPGLVRLVPFVMLAGMVYGLGRGGPGNLVYHETRGLIFGAMAFVVTWRLQPSSREVAGVAIAGTSALGLLTIFRYVSTLSGGRSGIPVEFWFEHETGLLLSVGGVLGMGLAIRLPRDRDRVLAFLYVVLMASAILVTGRRSAILVILVGVMVMAWMLLPKRTLLLTAIGVPLLFVSAVYLAIYWDGHSGPLAEPARAVRSQFQPDARDESSDLYREHERENLQRTLAKSPVFGIGFGLPYTRYVDLPVLGFWPLQFYTPHQNILWLWLKMGIAGIAVFAGMWVLAFSRCVRGARAVARKAPIPAMPIVLGSVLVMYLAYARVDIAFAGVRSSGPLAVALALAFMLPAEPGRREAGDA
ncbi:MAG: O-antigen ligase family protein [Dehalococcoidia bacterium]